MASAFVDPLHEGKLSEVTAKVALKQAICRAGTSNHFIPVIDWYAVAYLKQA
jgi:hypothetical protein